MSKAFAWFLVIVIAMGAIVYGGRAYASRAMSTRALTPKTLGTVTPATADIPFSRVAIESGDRTLIGWWVRARSDSTNRAPALLFFHGNRSAISDYVDLLKFFYRQGISTLVFDYSGFGASGGSASLGNAITDAANVSRVFAESAGPGTRKVAMGSALGATVLLQAIDSVQPHVNGLVIEGVDASVRAAAVRGGRLPGLLSRMVRDPANNVVAATRVRVPLLAIHSYADARVPLEDAQQVVEAVPGQAALVRHWRRGHSAILASSRPCDWAPVLSFVRNGVMPAAPLDTTDACKVEAARLAAAKADSVKADSVRKAAQAAAARARATAPTKAAATKTTTAPTKTPAAKTGTKTKSPVPATKRRPSV
jgi:alpha/beta superfamily hydrolase